MNQVKFDLTAAQVNTIDAAAITVKTLKTNTSIARFPIRLTLTKAAGTAYTCGAGARIQIKDSDGRILFDVDCDGFLDQTTVEGVAVAPATSGLLFRGGGTTTFTISATGSIASGTGVLSGRIFFEEECVIW